jgi:hypothetical protein
MFRSVESCESRRLFFLHLTFGLDRVGLPGLPLSLCPDSLVDCRLDCFGIAVHNSENHYGSYIYNMPRAETGNILLVHECRFLRSVVFEGVACRNRFFPDKPLAFQSKFSEEHGLNASFWHKLSRLRFQGRRATDWNCAPASCI